ncbi:Hypothetical predicted protein [Olea europaea subsp. europaea]|uniref:Uncharacterized protein n=1 Tax=Olea europaea subsp. europaea TaxID=158383 RepID=A0A8S0RCD4_OLEEU|nr:Hypothetical predicted protein [Olea europaea subsp. europaea]
MEEASMLLAPARQPPATHIQQPRARWKDNASRTPFVAFHSLCHFGEIKTTRPAGRHAVAPTYPRGTTNTATSSDGKTGSAVHSVNKAIKMKKGEIKRAGLRDKVL